MLKRREEWVEYGYDSFSPEQQKVIREIKEKFEKLLNGSVSDFLSNIKNVLESREIVAQVGDSSENPMAKYVGRIMNAGGAFVSVEMIYVMLILLCTFVTTPEESAKINELLVTFDKVMYKVYETREEDKR